MIDMSIQIKTAQYFQKRRSFIKMQKQVKNKQQIDQKLKLLLKSDSTTKNKSQTKLSNTSSYHLQNQHSNIEFFNQKFFQGKLYTAWVFILNKIPIKTLQRINQIQKQFSQDQNSSIIPFSSTFKGALKYFKPSQTYFKILIDLENAQHLANYLQKHRDFEKKISQIHIYSNKQDGKDQYDKIRQRISDKKIVTQLLYEIDCKLQDIRSYLMNSSKILKIQNNEYRQTNMLPAYMKLSDEDKTEITKYRLNLYRLINHNKQNQSKEMLGVFTHFIQRVYKQNQAQKQFLHQYINEKKQNKFTHKRALEFYSGQKFYYYVINAMLRVSHQMEDFKLIATPFIEIYTSIKYFYEKDKQKYQNQNKGFSLYRGAPFNIKNVKVDQYIELLGFVSTSKNKQVAKGFLKKGSCMIQIRVPAHIFYQNKNQDHGFVDFNQNIQSAHSDEEQVLINALNILKVAKIISKENSKSNYDSIVLQYGAIFQLQQGKKDNPQKLSLSDQQVLTNFEYCRQKMTQIKDQIDLLIQTQQYDQAIQKLEKKIYDDKEKTEQIMVKYAQALFENGQKQRSSIIARGVLSRFLQSSENEEDREKQFQKLEKHGQKVEQIFKVDDDNVSAKKVIQKQMQYIDDSVNPLQKVMKLYKLSEIQFQQGDIKRSEQNLMKGLQILGYSFEHLKKIDQMSQKTQYLHKDVENDHKTKQLALSIIFLLLKIYNHIGDSSSHKQWLKKSKQIFKQYENRVRNDPTKQHKLSQIKIQFLNHSKDQPSEKMQQLLTKAIQKQYQVNPVSQNIAKLTLQLAIIKAEQVLTNISEPSSQFFNSNQNKHEQNNVRLSESFIKQKVQQVEETFQKSIHIYSYHSGKNHPNVLKIRNQKSQFQYQRGDVVKSIDQSKIVIEAEEYKNTKIKAKATLILSKDYFYTGQLLKSFQTVQLSLKILHFAIIKEQKNPLYTHEFHLNQINVQSQILKIKLYNKQLKHDLALKTIQEVEKIVQKKLTNVKKVSYTANLLEQKGNTLALNKNISQALKYFNQAITLRQNQTGSFKIINAISYCNVAKYLIFYQNYKQAKKFIIKADEIFSKYPVHSPNNWVLSFVKSYLYEKTNNVEKQKQSILRCSQLIQQKYCSDHINYLLVKIRQAKILMKNSSKQQEYENVKQKLEYLALLLENDRSIDQFQWTNPKTQNQKVQLIQQIDNCLSQLKYKLIKSNKRYIFTLKNRLFVSMSQIKQAITKKSSLNLCVSFVKKPFFTLKILVILILFIKNINNFTNRNDKNDKIRILVIIKLDKSLKENFIRNNGRVIINKELTSQKRFFIKSIMNNKKEVSY